MNIKSYNLHKTAHISVCFLDSAHYDSVEHDHCIFVAVNYDRKPIKCYDFF